MRIYYVACLFLALSLCSCLTILQSLVTRDTILTDDRVTGEWISSDSKVLSIQKFLDSKYGSILMKEDHPDKNDSAFLTKTYIITYKENNLNYSWLAGIIVIENQFYINLLSVECLNAQNKNIYDIGKTLETSSIAKLEWQNRNQLGLHFLNGDRIKQIVLNGNARISHEYDPLFNTFVITASSSELIKFLEKYGDNPKLYEGAKNLNLVRKR